MIPRWNSEHGEVSDSMDLIELPAADLPQVQGAGSSGKWVSGPSKTSSVPRSRNERITGYIITTPVIAIKLILSPPNDHVHRRALAGLVQRLVICHRQLQIG